MQMQELIPARPRIPVTQSHNSATDSRNPCNGVETQETRNRLLPKNDRKLALYRDAPKRELLTRVRKRTRLIDTCQEGGAGARVIAR